MMPPMNCTPLHANHTDLNAKMTDFAGWDMPLSYSGALDEYQAVRTTVGLFDVSHMGRFMAEGEGIHFLQRITTNNVESLAPGQAQYSMVCNHDGGILDDILVYRLADNRFLVCANASNRQKLWEWFQRHDDRSLIANGVIRDQTTTMGQIAIQGPKSKDVLQQCAGNSFPALPPRGCVESEILGSHGIIARTGYTGEHGYELYLPASDLPQVWTALLEAGKAAGIKPCGLSARDLLRLEAGFLLYGNDISEDTTPLEAGVEWVVEYSKPDFIGKDALLKQKGAGPARRLIAFEMLQMAVPRHNYPIAFGEQEIGIVTSGNFFPHKQQGLGMGYVKTPFSKPGTEISVVIRYRSLPALVAKPPFHKKKL
ncbi:MAG: glycine cleavage system protein T [Nitrospiraceae bacterium]|nr:glycine cleavage system protein T [Nitrospiraceae bacterium]|tara:strand:- start:556 stop:1662 length:1107 start_codon:yes stop_codon:yes gene_type:complete